MSFTAAVVILVLEGLLGLWLLYRAGVLKKRISWVLCTLLLALAMGLRAAVFDYETLDYINFLARWVDFFRQWGNFRALRYPLGTLGRAAGLERPAPVQPVYKEPRAPDRGVLCDALPADGVSQQCRLGPV